jgi:hypothetical protein
MENNRHVMYMLVFSLGWIQYCSSIQYECNPIWDGAHKGKVFPHRKRQQKWILCPTEHPNSVWRVANSGYPSNLFYSHLVLPEPASSSATPPICSPSSSTTFCKYFHWWSFRVHTKWVASVWWGINSLPLATALVPCRFEPSSGRKVLEK